MNNSSTVLLLNICPLFVVVIVIMLEMYNRQQTDGYYDDIGLFRAIVHLFVGCCWLLFFLSLFFIVGLFLVLVIVGCWLLVIVDRFLFALFV